MSTGASLDRKIYSLFKRGVFDGALAIIGSPQRAIDLTAITITPSTDRSYAAIAIGHRGGTTLDFTMTAAAVAQHVDPIQLEIAIKGVNPGATSTINAIYQQITHATANMAALRLKNADWTIIVSKNLMDAYCLQTEIDVTGTAGISGQCAAVSAAVQISGSGTLAEVQALYASVGGSGAFTSNEATVGKFVYSNSGKKAKAAIEINVAAFASASAALRFSGGGALDAIFDFTGIPASAVTEDNLAAPNKAGYIKVVLPSGAAGYINVYDGTPA